MKKKSKKPKDENCRPLFEITKAGHLLATKGYSSAGKILATKGKLEKSKRKAKGCLNGPEGTFKLTDKQKKKLPIALQKSILAFHRKNGKRMID